MIQFLLDDILAFHHTLSDAFVMEKGVSDIGLLESAVHAPFQSFAEQELYSDLYSKAARLCFGITKNHPFVDGNKRTAVHAMLVYLDVNSVELEYDDDDLENTIIAVSSSNMSCDELAVWLKQHIKQDKPSGI